MGTKVMLQGYVGERNREQSKAEMEMKPHRLLHRPEGAFSKKLISIVGGTQQHARQLKARKALPALRSTHA